ncbi:hypothetical protein XPA_001114 [Xanthoria parietina]
MAALLLNPPNHRSQSCKIDPFIRHLVLCRQCLAIHDSVEVSISNELHRIVIGVGAEHKGSVSAVEYVYDVFWLYLTVTETEPTLSRGKECGVLLPNKTI